MMLRNLRLSKPAVITAIFILSLAIRAFLVFQWQATPYGAEPLLDAQAYNDWAQSIADGHILRANAFYQSPLFPYVLGLLYHIFGHSLLIAGLFNAFLSTAAVAVLSALTWTCFGMEAAVGAGVLAAFYRPFIFYTAPVMKEPLGLLLLALFLVFALRLLKKNRAREFFWCGALLGLCALVRGNVLFLAPVLLLLAFLKWRRAAAKNAAVFVGALVLFIAPATIHNFIASGDFVPINYADGFNFYIGNSPAANGTNAYPPEVSTDPVQEELSTTWTAQKESGRALRPSEVSKFWRNRAIDYILNNPVRDIILLQDKLQSFLSTSEQFDNYDAKFIEKNFNTVLTWPLPEFWLILSLAAFGAVAVDRHRKNIVVALVAMACAYVASVLLFYVTDRYRLPVVVFLLPLAGAALPCGWQLIQKKNWQRLAAASAMALSFLFLSLQPVVNTTDLTAFDWGTLSMIYGDTGRDREAIEALHKGLAISSQEVGSQALVRGSFVEQHLGHDGESLRLLDMAMQLYPQDGVVWYNYGRMKAAKGDLKGALSMFQKAAELAPSYVLNYYALAKVYIRLGDRKSAMDAVRSGLAIDPDNVLLREAYVELK